MTDREIEDLRAYHERRCQQERERLRNARMPSVARAHGELLQLLWIKRIELSVARSDVRAGASSPSTA